VERTAQAAAVLQVEDTYQVGEISAGMSRSLKPDLQRRVRPCRQAAEPYWIAVDQAGGDSTSCRRRGRHPNVILSHRYQFIFLNTRKTANTSIEIALARCCGPEDVVTPLLAEDQEMLRREGHPGSQHVRVPWREYRGRDWARLLFRGRRTKYYTHMDALAVQRRVSREVWERYYKFCFERNPWDKAISLYYWRTRDQQPRPSLSDYLRTVEPESLSNYGIYSIAGEVVVDHVARYEDLTGELERIAARLHLPGRLDLPQTKVTQRQDRRHYRDVLSAADRAIINRVCAREIALLGYVY
jgi:hypothetical protein